MHFIEQAPNVATIGGRTLRVAHSESGAWILVVSAGADGATLVLLHEGSATELGGLVRKWLLPRADQAVQRYEEVRKCLQGLPEDSPLGAVLSRLPQRASALHHPRHERRSRFDRRGA